ncbi:MAG: hypothetical protein ACYDCW_07935 [Acidithiobacillus ferrivorans]
MLNKKVKKVLTIAVLSAIGVAMPFEQVYAATSGMNWSQQSTFSASPGINQIFSGLKDDHIYVGSNLGAAVAAVRLNANQVKALTGSGQTFNMPWNTPVVFATYDPGTTSGTIFVTRLIKQPDGAGIIELAQFSPTMGGVFAADFENTNPFWQFAANQNGNGAAPDPGAFVSITSAAFYTAVGLVMQHVNSTIGWIATDNNNAHMSTSSSSDFITATVTHKETVMTSPTWTAVVPQGGAPSSDYGYLLPIPSSASSTVEGAIALENSSAGAHTIGGLTSAVAQFGSEYYGQLEVNGGYAYVPAGNGATLPTAAFESFFHSTHHTGFIGWFMDLMLSVITGMPPTMTFLVGAVYNVATQGTAGFGTIQEHLVGGNCGQQAGACYTAPPVNMAAAYNSAQSYSGYSEGYINVDTNPTQTSGQWDYQPTAAAATETNPNQAQGGFSQGYQQTQASAAQAQKGEDLQTLSGQVQQTGSGLASFGGGATSVISGAQPAPQ